MDFFAYPREIEYLVDTFEDMIFGDEVTKGTCHEEVFLPPILSSNHAKPPCKRLNFVLEILPAEVHIDYGNAEDFFNNPSVPILNRQFYQCYCSERYCQNAYDEFQFLDADFLYGVG